MQIVLLKDLELWEILCIYHEGKKGNSDKKIQELKKFALSTLKTNFCMK